MTDAVKRVLAVLRLSDNTDESTSTARQWDIIDAWRNANGYVMAGRAEDLDVSGGMDPFRRPELGPWLARSQDFDTIAVWKLDRLTRRARHFADLLDWCEHHGKTIVSVTEGFDLSTSMGKMFARIIAAFAEGELDVITDRVKDSHKKLRAVGRYAGGSLPFAYMPIDLPGGGKRLAPDPEYAPILRWIVKEVIDGASCASIARQLNERRTPSWGARREAIRGRVSLKKQRWTADVVLQIVKNPAVAGYRTQRVKDSNGAFLKFSRIVLDPDGEPVMATDEPVISPHDWQKAVKALQSRSTAPAVRMAHSASLLQGVIVCGSCRNNLYVHRITKTVGGAKKVYAYYACHSRAKQRECKAPVRIDVKGANEQASGAMLTLLRGVEITREEYDPGQDYSAQIAEAAAILDELEDDFMSGKYKGDEAKARYQRMHSKLTAKIDGLRALPSRPATTRVVGTGETYGQRWERNTDLERRDFLLDKGIRFEAHAAGTTIKKDILGKAMPTTEYEIRVHIPGNILTQSETGALRLALPS